MKFKNFIPLFLLFCFIPFCFTGCGTPVSSKSSSKINVVATLFPQYDFAKNIAGDKADVSLLLPPGTESHTYEPTPADIIKMSESDLFLYTGKYMEPWAERLISSVSSKNFKPTDVSTNISLIKSEHHHDHEHDHDHDHHHHHEEHSHEFDPHIWLDPTLACQMVDNIKSAFVNLDPENASFYEQNATDYKNKLLSLDKDFQTAVENGSRKKIVFAGRFAHLYFINRYSLEYKSAFDGCSTEMEPSVKKVTEIIDFVTQNQIPCVYYEELSEPKIATFIAEHSNVKILKFSTAHNLSKDQIEAGTSYIDVMTENLQNLKIGLN